MVFRTRCCPYCQQAFQPSPRRPDQAVCSRPECQARRRSDYRRRKRQTDSEYAEVVRDSRRKWREAHPDYQKNYWQNHPEAAARNRQQQRQRDQKRREFSVAVRSSETVALCHPIMPVGNGFGGGGVGFDGRQLG